MAAMSNDLIEYPIYRGPLYMCCYCKTMFISEEFLNKHHKKCIHMAFISILKSHLNIKILQSPGELSTPTEPNIEINEGNFELVHQSCPQSPNKQIQDFGDSTEIGDKDKAPFDYYCADCTCGFSKLSDYARHIRDSHSDPYKCDQCDNNFISASLLQAHISTVHQLETDFKCDICGKSFMNKSKLITHKRSHTGERPYACPHCPSKFTQTGILNRHLLIHAEMKPFKCTECPMSFTLKGNLIRHLRYHSGERPFSCDHCDKRFTQHGSLVNHLRTHTGEKPYKCTECPRRFTQKGDLTQHLRIHSGERPYGCHICDKRFAQKSNLNIHLRIHSGEKPFLCTACPMRFTHKSNLNNHFKIHSNSSARSVVQHASSLASASTNNSIP